MTASIASYRSSPIKPRRATSTEMEQRYDQLVAIVRGIAPCTVRQTFYQMTVRHSFEKSEAGYTRVQEALVKLRRDGRIP